MALPRVDELRGVRGGRSLRPLAGPVPGPLASTPDAVRVWCLDRDRGRPRGHGTQEAPRVRGIRALLEGGGGEREGGRVTARLSRRVEERCPSSTVAVGKAAKALAGTGVDVVDFGI